MDFIYLIPAALITILLVMIYNELCIIRNYLREVIKASWQTTYGTDTK